MAVISNADNDKIKPAAGERSDLMLTGFIEQRANGVFVDTSKLQSPEEFQRAVDRILSSGHFFGGLDYPVFQRLLFEFDPKRQNGQVCLAHEIREFPPARRALYRAVKIIKGEVEYIFEPVELETTIDAPVYAIDENGQRQVVGSETKVVTEKALLDVDEFIADLWSKGVRFGIDVARVRTAIEEGRMERVVVARDRQPTSGRDAGIEAQTAELYRDNAPRELPNGRIDLGQFQNRFPQVRKGTTLLMKTPRQLGDAGRTIAGARLEPPPCKDFDLTKLAGEGTRVEVQGDRQYIVAAMDGFLSLDSKTNRMSITEKIINRDGVSARTTGNLALAGDQYEEFGEVQEGRTVEGKSLTFHADVFGKVLSSGGSIVIEQNLVGGTALNRGGPITVNGLASNAVLQTARGTLFLKRAENCVLVGDRVEVESASNCTILAEEVEIQVARGCAIAGKRVHLGTGGTSRGQETLVSVLLPDFSGMDAAENKERQHIAECETLMENLKRAVEQLTKQPELRNYFSIAGKILRKEITLTPEQQGQWQQMRSRLGPELKRVNQGREDIKALEGEIAASRERIAALYAEKDKAASGVECRVDMIDGDVVVRTLTVAVDAPPLNRLPPRDLRQRLAAPDPASRRVFAGSQGDFAWRLERSAG